MKSLIDSLASLQNDDRPGMTYQGYTTPWSRVVSESSTRSEILQNFLDPSQPARVGILIEDAAEYLLWTAGAAQGGASIVGLDSLQSRPIADRSTAIANCHLIVSDDRGLDVLEELDLDRSRAIDLNSTSYLVLVDAAPRTANAPTGSIDDRLLLTFLDDSSNTIDVTLGRATRAAHHVVRATEMTRYDICYDPLPLGHENSLLACWAPAVVAGSELVVPQTYSAETFLADVRDFNCTYFAFSGSMIADLLDVPQTSQDSEHRLRIGFGTESTPSERLEFAQRYGCPLIDADPWHASVMFGA